MPPPRVLVVDDEADIRTIVGLNLRLAGVEVAEAADGATALDHLREGTWDGCVMDLAMPIMDGLTLLRHLGAEGLLEKMTVVVLSARGTPMDALEALELGAHAHLSKPFAPGAIAGVVLELLGLDPAQRELRRHEMAARAGSLRRLGVPTV